MTIENHRLKRNMAIVTGLLAVAFLITLWLPFITHYRWNESTEAMTDSYNETLSGAPYLGLFVMNFVITLLATISLNKWLAIIVNILMLLWVWFVLFAFNYAFVWDGQPVHPKFAYGCWLNQLVILVLIICSFYWAGSFRQLAPSKAYVRIMTGVVFICIFSLFFGIYRYLFVPDTSPMLLDVNYLYDEEGNEKARVEMWEYKDYEAYVNKYYGGEVNGAIGHLDSAEFSFLDANKPKFTRIVKNEEEIEDILEETAD